MNKKWRNLIGIPLMTLALASVLGVSSVAADYYATITNTTNGSNLSSSLHTLITNTHTTKLSYPNVWTAYKTTDTFPGTSIIWDTYSEYLYTYGTDQTGSAGYTGEGDNYNREHTVPQSWFDKDSPMVADVFHILATDGKVNGVRSNYPYGEVGTSTYTAGNGGMLGNSKLSGYSGTVFEPIDEYKGDIARGYFYMAIRYSDKLANWGEGAEVVFTSSYPYLTSYALDLFTKWSHLDPVSDKEIIRNDAIKDIQGNRNPFIDHPEWIDVIWSNSYTDTDSNTKYSTQNVISAINTISSSSTAKDVYGVYAKYCRLNTKDKKLVTNASTLFSLVESKANSSIDLDTYWENITSSATVDTTDEAKVNNVISLIDQLPTTITKEDQTQINACNDAYLALNSAEKALVTNYSILENAIATLNNLLSQERIDNVIALIAALPDTITESDKTQVNEAKAAYLALSSEEKASVTNYSKLEAAIETINSLTNTSDSVEMSTFTETNADMDEYISYTTAKGGGTTNPGIYSNIIRLYQNAAGTGGGLIKIYSKGNYVITSVTIGSSTATTIAYTLDDSTIKSENQSLAANNTIKVDNLDVTSITFYCMGTTDKARLNVNYLKVEYEALNSEEEVNQVAIDNVINLINALPEVVTLSTEEDILDIEASYASLTALEKTKVTNISVLQTKRAELNTLMKDINTFTATSTKASMKFNYDVTVTGSDDNVTYNLVSNANELKVGDVIVIAASDANYALSSTQNDNNRGQVEITKESNIITFGDDVELITLERGTVENTFAFKVTSGYLHAASSSKNYLRTQNKIDENASWLITYSSGVASIVAQGNYTNNKLMYNSSSSIFSCYSSTQKQVAIYKKTGGQETTIDVSNAHIRFGGGISKSTYQGLLALGENVSFGVSLSKDGINYTDYAVTPVYVNSIGDTVENANGKYVQYSVLIPVNEANYNTLIYAKCYVEIDGVKYYMQISNYSLHTLALNYIQNKTTLGISDEVALVLGEF